MAHDIIERLKRDPHFQVPSEERSIITQKVLAMPSSYKLTYRSMVQLRRGYYNDTYPSIPLGTTGFDKVNTFTKIDFSDLIYSVRSKKYDIYSKNPYNVYDTPVPLYQEKFVKVGYGHFDGADLRGFNFSLSNLGIGLNFRGADLSNANFYKTQGSYITFENANLESINFKSIKYIGAIKFKNTNLKKANFSDAKIDEGDFYGANLEEANFSNVMINYINFGNTNLKNVDFNQTKIPNIYPGNWNPLERDETIPDLTLSSSKNLLLSELPESLVEAAISKRHNELGERIADQVLGKNTLFQQTVGFVGTFSPREKLLKLLKEILITYQNFFDSVSVEEREATADEIANLLKIDLALSDIVPVTSSIAGKTYNFLQTSLSVPPLVKTLKATTFKKARIAPSETIDVKKIEKAEKLEDIVQKEKLEAQLGYYAIGVYKLKTNNPEKAVEFFNKVSESSTDYGAAMVYAGNAYMPPPDALMSEEERTERYRIAFYYFKKAVDKDNNNREAKMLLAVCVSNLYYVAEQTTHYKTGDSEHFETLKVTDKNVVFFFCLKKNKKDFEKLGCKLREPTRADFGIDSLLKLTGK